MSAFLQQKIIRHSKRHQNEPKKKKQNTQFEETDQASEPESNRSWVPELSDQEFETIMINMLKGITDKVPVSPSWPEVDVLPLLFHFFCHTISSWAALTTNRLLLVWESQLWTTWGPWFLMYHQQFTFHMCLDTCVMAEAAGQMHW